MSYFDICGLSSSGFADSLIYVSTCLLYFDLFRYLGYFYFIRDSFWLQIIFDIFDKGLNVVCSDGCYLFLGLDFIDVFIDMLSLLNRWSLKGFTLLSTNLLVVIFEDDSFGGLSECPCYSTRLKRLHLFLLIFIICIYFLKSYSYTFSKLNFAIFSFKVSNLLVSLFPSTSPFVSSAFHSPNPS